MDRVRFGRALGYGARHAIKTLVTAVDAATSEDPSAKTHPAAHPSSGSAASTASYAPTTRSQASRTQPLASAPVRTAAESAAKSVAQARQVKQGLGRGGKRLGEVVWGPFVRLSGVLWLEVSGVFFGLFALIALGYLWKLRGAWHTGATSHRNLLGAAGMFALFGYFCVTNFVQARRRERRH